MLHPVDSLDQGQDLPFTDDPETRTRIGLNALQSLVTAYHTRTGGRLPESLHDLGRMGLRAYRAGLDGWGQPMRYRRWSDSFELRSAGPDRMFDTADDLRLEGLSVTPSEPADPVSVCVVEAAATRLVPAKSREHGYPPAPPPHADSRAWYARAETITFGGRTLLRHARTLTLLPEELQRVGTYDGIAVFAEAGVSPPHEVVYLPVSPGCEYRPYENLTS